MVTGTSRADRNAAYLSKSTNWFRIDEVGRSEVTPNKNLRQHHPHGYAGVLARVISFRDDLSYFTELISNDQSDYRDIIYEENIVSLSVEGLHSLHRSRSRGEGLSTTGTRSFPRGK